MKRLVIERPSRPAQILGVAVFSGMATYGSAMIGKPSPWHLIWMVLLPIMLGVAANRGIARMIMPAICLIVDWGAVTGVGAAMGGI